MATSVHRERRRDSAWWQAVVTVAAIAAAVVAVAVTLRAEFLRYPEWLAAQKADFIIGPALTGVYWLRRRPQSPFGPMLIAWAFVGVLYILQSSSDSWLFTIGLFWEKVFGLSTYVLILAFPTGRLDRPSKIVLVGRCRHRARVVHRDPAAVAAARRGRLDLELPGAVPAQRARDHVGPGAGGRPVQGVQLLAVLALALATAVLVIHRFVTGTPPRRRALAVGTPVALLFLLCEILYQLLNILGAEDTGLYGIVIWVFVAARAGVWYGFLFALIAAELFAARAMQRLVEQSLHHPPGTSSS